MSTIDRETTVNQTEKKGFSSRRVRIVPVRVSLHSLDDVAIAESELTALAERMQMDRVTVALVAEAVQRVARNVIQHAGRGGVCARRTDRGLHVEIHDDGPGFPPVILHAVNDGGHNLPPGCSLQVILNTRMVDEMRIISMPGNTQVILEKFWTVPEPDAHPTN